LAVVLPLVAAGTSCASQEPTPLGISVRDNRLLLSVSCADDVDAEFTEYTDQVRVHDISGDPVDGDCVGGTALTLTQPLGNRALVVEGDTWRRVRRSCGYGEFGPGDIPRCEPEP
jgi:hypothetical protein